MGLAQHAVQRHTSKQVQLDLGSESQPSDPGVCYRLLHLMEVVDRQVSVLAKFSAVTQT